MSTVQSPKAQVRVHIRWMIRRDMPEVLAIEHASFDFPWCEEEFLRVLRQRNCIGMVAEVGEHVVGFMIYELHKNKLHVLDFAAHPDFRRQGVGQQMVSKLVGKLSSHRRTKIVLHIRETSLAAQGRGETVIEPRMHIEPGVANGHFNVLRGAIGGPIDSAGVKVVGDFVDNYKLGYPSEFGVLVLFNPHNGMPRAFIEAGGITDMRTGAMTAVGAKYLARKNSKILGHIGARGSSYWNAFRACARVFFSDERSSACSSTSSSNFSNTRC